MTCALTLIIQEETGTRLELQHINYEPPHLPGPWLCPYHAGQHRSSAGSRSYFCHCKISSVERAIGSLRPALGHRGVLCSPSRDSPVPPSAGPTRTLNLLQGQNLALGIYCTGRRGGVSCPPARLCAGPVSLSATRHCPPAPSPPTPQPHAKHPAPAMPKGHRAKEAATHSHW